MYLKKYILLSVIPTLLITSAQASHAAARSLHYTPPEPADMMKHQPDKPVSSFEQDTAKRLKYPLKLEEPFKKTYEEKVNPVTNEVEEVRQGMAVEW